MENFVNKVVLDEINVYYLSAAYFRKRPGEWRATGVWLSTETQAKRVDI